MTALPEGFPRSKADTAHRVWVCKWANEQCERTKPCKQCLGARNRRKGLKKQRAVAKTIGKLSGVPVGRYASQTGNEENWRTTIRWEVKAGQQVKGFTTTFTNAEAQAEAAHGIGDPRPFGFVAVPDGWPEGECLMTFRSRDIRAVFDGFLLAGDVA